MILSLFNQLPESEKLRLILHTKGVLHDIELLKNDVYDLINNQKNRKRNPSTNGTFAVPFFLPASEINTFILTLQPKLYVALFITSTTNALLSGGKRSAGRRQGRG